MSKSSLTIVLVIIALVHQCNCKVICINDNLIANTMKCQSIGVLFNFLKEDEHSLKRTTTTLVLRDCNVGHIDSNYFGKMWHLKNLDLSMNLLKEMPVGTFKDLVDLESLNMSRNIIHTIDKNSFSKMTKLKEVDLSYNYLKITYKLFGDSLRFLDLSKNVEVDIAQSSFEDLRLNTLMLRQSLKSFPDTFQFSEIVHLDVSENRNFFEMGKIGKQFALLDGLIRLNMAMCGLVEINLELNTNLRFLNVSKNAILLDEHTFYSNDKLVELDLCSNKIDKLPNYVFDSCVEMVKLHLCNNKLTSLRAESFSKMIKLQVLDLSRNQLITTVKFPDTISSLDLSNNRLELFEDAVFDNMKSLLVLNLSGNRLSSVNAKLLQNPKLQYLDLRCNQLVSIIEGYLKNRQSLLHLYLRGNPWNCACINFIFDNSKSFNNVAFHDELSCVVERSARGCNVNNENRIKWLKSYNEGPNPCESKNN